MQRSLQFQHDKSSNEDMEPPKDTSDISEIVNTLSEAENFPHEIKRNLWSDENLPAADNGTASESEYERIAVEDSIGQDHETSKVFDSKLFSGFINKNEATGEVFYDCDSHEFASEELIQRTSKSKLNNQRKKCSESEISGSESDSDSSDTLFMKSDSDTSIETVVDNKVETDFKDSDNKNLATKNFNDDILEGNAVANIGTSFTEDISLSNDDTLTPKKENFSIDETIELKIDCDSGFSSQVDMTQFTADVMTLRHEVPLRDQKSTEPVTSSKQIYFNASEGSIITFEYNAQDEITDNFDKFNDTYIDLVRKDCPNKMAQLVYQAGLKALDSNNRKHLCCVFMLENDKGQIDKLFESSNNQVPESLIFEQNHAENSEIIEENDLCSYNSSDSLPIIQRSSKLVTKLLPDSNLIQENYTVSGLWNKKIEDNMISSVNSSVEYAKNFNLKYEDFKSEVVVPTKDLTENVIQEIIFLDTSSQEKSRKMRFSVSEIEKIRKELDQFFKDKVIKVAGIKCQSIENNDGSSNLNDISLKLIENTELYLTLRNKITINKENKFKYFSANELITGNKENNSYFKKSDLCIDKNSSIASVLKSEKSEDKIIKEVSEPLQNQDKTNDKRFLSNSGNTVELSISSKSVEKDIQEAIMNSDEIEFKSKEIFIEKSNKNFDHFMRKYPNVEIIEDFSKLIIGSVGLCSSNIKINGSSMHQGDENEKIPYRCDEKEKPSIRKSTGTRDHSLSCTQIMTETDSVQNSQVIPSTSKDKFKYEKRWQINKSEESFQQIISSIPAENVKILHFEEAVNNVALTYENKDDNLKVKFQKMSIDEESSKCKGHNLLEKVLTDKFQAKNHILHVNENAIRKTIVNPDSQSQHVFVMPSNKRSEILKTEVNSEPDTIFTSNIIHKSLKEKEDSTLKVSFQFETYSENNSQLPELVSEIKTFQSFVLEVPEQKSKNADKSFSSTLDEKGTELENNQRIICNSLKKKEKQTDETFCESYSFNKNTSELKMNKDAALTKLSSETQSMKNQIPTLAVKANLGSKVVSNVETIKTVFTESSDEQATLTKDSKPCSKFKFKPSEQKEKHRKLTSETVLSSTKFLEEKESATIIISSIPEYNLNFPRPPKQEMQKETMSKNLSVQINIPNLSRQKTEPSTEIKATEKLMIQLPKKKRKRSYSCSRLDHKIKVSFLSSSGQSESSSQTNEGSSESWSENSEESISVDDTKPQYVRSAVHLLNSPDLPYTPYKIVWIKSIIKRIDKIGILECHIDIPLKMRPKPVDNLTDINIRPIIPRSNTELRGLVAGGVKNEASTSSAASEDLEFRCLEESDNSVSIWQPPPRDEYGIIPRSNTTYRLNADAAEYVPIIYSYRPNIIDINYNPDIYLEFKPDIIKRSYRAINPYDNLQNIRFLPKQQIPFFPSGVYVARNGNVRLNFRSFISIDITVDLGIRVTYPFSNICLALSHSGEHAAMIHPCGSIYQNHDVIEANIFDGYTGSCKVAKIAERAVYFSNEPTNIVYLVDKYGTHRNRTTTFFRFREDFSAEILTHGRHGPQYNDEAVRMLAGAKFETCGFNHIIIIKNVKIIQYPTGNLSIFRFDRRDHIQICPNEGHCKISTPNAHMTATLNVTDNKPHIFIRKDDRRLSFSPEKFFVRTDGQTAGFNSSKKIFIDYPI